MRGLATSHLGTAGSYASSIGIAVNRIHYTSGLHFKDFLIES